jgi:glycosyltransferase involved in cell wall biosynthesis
MTADLIDAGVPVRALPCVDPWSGGVPPGRRDLLAATYATAGTLHRAQPDVVHVTLAWPSFGRSSMLAPALLGLPAVVVFQLVPEAIELPWPAGAYRAMHARRQRWVAVSDHGRSAIAQGVGLTPQEISVIYNGVGREGTRHVSASERRLVRAELRASLGLDADSRVVLSVGRLDTQKAHADLIQALAPLFDAEGDLHLLIAGDGPERQRLEGLLVETGTDGRVRLLGRRSDVPSLLATADVFAFPSHYEGLPFALIEAMSAGVPVVTARFPGVEEVVRDGVEGVIVPVGDVAALGGAVHATLEQPEAAARMARAARERAAMFSADQMIDRTLALLAAAGASGSVRAASGRTWISRGAGPSAGPGRRGPGAARDPRARPRRGTSPRRPRGSQ